MPCPENALFVGRVTHICSGSVWLSLIIGQVSSVFATFSASALSLIVIFHLHVIYVVK